jgi:hypothetical protein
MNENEDFDVGVLIRALRTDDHSLLQSLIESLKTNPQGPRLLERLAHQPDAGVRSWVSGVAAEVAGRAALPWLVEMARRDRDSENRSEALQTILEIDPEAVLSLIPRLRSQLRSPDKDYAADAARALTYVGDRESLPEMRALAQSWSLDGYTGDAKRLETYILALEGRYEELFARIRDHDHISMPWLAFAVGQWVRTTSGRSVLEWGVSNLPDGECRRWCDRAIRDGRWRT